MDKTAHGTSPAGRRRGRPRDVIALWPHHLLLPNVGSSLSPLHFYCLTPQLSHLVLPHHLQRHWLRSRENKTSSHPLF